jgi:hypothetical protein
LLKVDFQRLLDPSSGLIKAMVSINHP